MSERTKAFISRAAIMGLTLFASSTAGAATVGFQFYGADPTPYAVFGRRVIDPVSNTLVDSPAMQGGRFRMSNLNTGTFEGDFYGPDPVFWGFCIEPREGISNGVYMYDLVALEYGTTNIGGMGTLKANRLRELFARWYPDFSVPISSIMAGALQIATWEIVREDSGTLDVYAGTITFYSNGSTSPVGVVDLAQTYVQSITGTGPRLYTLAALNKAGSPGTQDLIVQVEDLPEPGSILLAAAGLIAIGAAKLRGRRL